jgi:hypothetical protein
MKPSPAISMAAVLIPVTVALGGCEGNVQEPWVSTPDELRLERERSSDQAKELRERLALVQSDR